MHECTHPTGTDHAPTPLGLLFFTNFIVFDFRALPPHMTPHLYVLLANIIVLCPLYVCIERCHKYINAVNYDSNLITIVQRVLY